MWQTVRDEHDFFKKLYKNLEDGEAFKSILSRMTRKQTNALAEVALNVLFGAIGVCFQKRRRFQAIKPFLRSLSAPGLGTPTRKKSALTHVNEDATLVELIYRNLDELIWRNVAAAE